MTDQPRLGRPPIYGERTRDVRAQVPDTVADALDAEAAARKTSRSRVVVEALRRFLVRRLKAQVR